MPEEFEGDLTEAVFWGADMSRARFRDVNLTGARISHSFVIDVDIDAFVDRLVVNGVDVTGYVNERDEWYPMRALIRSSDPTGLQAGWAALEEAWAGTIARARALGEEKAQESVNGEFSFAQTVRHLVFAMEKWFNMPILGEKRFHPMGLPNTGSLEFPWPGLDFTVQPSLEEALAVRAERAATFRDYLADVDAADFDRAVEVLENGKATVLECLHTVMEEEFWHNRYARRDLATLEQTEERPVS